MSKPFKTHNQQLKILRDRNIIIKNGTKAKAILIRENYYQLINGYKSIFLDRIETKTRKSDYYKDGTTFEQIYALFTLDRNLRNIFLKYLLMAENSIRSKIAYQFSKEHEKEAFSYFNINNYRDNDHQNTTALIAELSSVTKNNTDSITKTGPFFHYLSEHKELPLWVLVTKLSLGQTCKLFYNLKDDTKIEILKSMLYEFNKNSAAGRKLVQPSKYLNEFMGLLNCIKAFRNVCAHEDRLYDYIAKNRKGKQIQSNYFYLITAPQFKSGLYDIILVLRFFLSKSDYKNLIHEFEKEIEDLRKNFPSNLFSEVTKRMNLPKNWQATLKNYI